MKTAVLRRSHASLEFIWAAAHQRTLVAKISKMNKIDKEKMLKEALQIARDIIRGDKDPNQGCSELGDINHALDWPEELSAFGLLSHEQYDHENLGITAENCVPDIIKECKSLIKNLS